MMLSYGGLQSMPDTSQGTGTTQCDGGESGLCVASPIPPPHTHTLDVASSLSFTLC